MLYYKGILGKESGHVSGHKGQIKGGTFNESEL